MTALDQGSAMVGERVSGRARQAEPGHGTTVLVRQCRAWLVAAVQWLRWLGLGGGSSDG